jgi:predicted flap endonuclease-1-like 5' DNA nuclease
VTIPASHRAGREAGIARANQKAAELAPVIAELRAAGVTSLRAIAVALNERGIPTLAGSARWHHAQVARVLARLARPIRAEMA